jgi:hypothetical protein
MKTWLSFLLPSDEYKEKKMLQFLSEGGVLLFLSLIAALIGNQYIQLQGIDNEVVLLILSGIFVLYVSSRYILSGMEYTDISSDREYKKELRRITNKILIFFVTFLLLYLWADKLPSNLFGWFSIIGPLLGTCFIWYLASYLSLKNSYNKNRDLE